MSRGSTHEEYPGTREIAKRRIVLYRSPIVVSKEVGHFKTGRGVGFSSLEVPFLLVEERYFIRSGLDWTMCHLREKVL